MSWLGKIGIFLGLGAVAAFVLVKLPMIGPLLAANSTVAFLTSNGWLLLAFGGFLYGYDRWRHMGIALIAAVLAFGIAALIGIQTPLGMVKL